MAMKSAILGAVLFAVFTLPVRDSYSQSTRESKVPDAGTAVKIAEPILVRTYGKRQIEYERPLTAKLEDGV